MHLFEKMRRLCRSHRRVIPCANELVLETKIAISNGTNAVSDGPELRFPCASYLRNAPILTSKKL